MPSWRSFKKFAFNVVASGFIGVGTGTSAMAIPYAIRLYAEPASNAEYWFQILSVTLGAVTALFTTIALTINRYRYDHKRDLLRKKNQNLETHHHTQTEIIKTLSLHLTEMQRKLLPEVFHLLQTEENTASARDKIRQLAGGNQPPLTQDDLLTLDLYMSDNSINAALHHQAHLIDQRKLGFIASVLNAISGFTGAFATSLLTDVVLRDLQNEEQTYEDQILNYKVIVSCFVFALIGCAINYRSALRKHEKLCAINNEGVQLHNSIVASGTQINSLVAAINAQAQMVEQFVQGETLEANAHAAPPKPLARTPLLHDALRELMCNTRTTSQVIPIPEEDDIVTGSPDSSLLHAQGTRTRDHYGSINAP